MLLFQIFNRNIQKLKVALSISRLKEIECLLFYEHSNIEERQVNTVIK